jgi:hypothetical protein
MLIEIKGEQEAIKTEICVLERVRYKLSNQLRHFKQFNQIKVIIQLVQTQLQQLNSLQTTSIQEISSINMQPYLDANLRIKSHIIAKGHQLKSLLKRSIFIQFSTIVLGCLATLNNNNDRIKKKLDALSRIIQEVSASKINVA